MNIGLRARIAIALALLALLLSTVMAALTYTVARSYLINQREALVVRQAGLNARAMNAALSSPDDNISELLASLPSSSGSHGLARVAGRWYSSSVPLERQDLPPRLVDAAAGRPVSQRVALNGTPAIVVGIPLNRATGQYFEVAPLNELERTLTVLGGSLAAAAVATAIIGALVGLYASRRVVRPLRAFSDAAGAIERGRLDTRLAVAADPDLAAFGAAFNDMAEALEQRSERDARFASDVSHELRNPLTALSTAVDVLEARADERTRPAIVVIRDQVDHFRTLVLDLLELARLDASGVMLDTEAVDVRSYIPRVLDENGGAHIAVTFGSEVPARVVLDPRRVERVLANLIDNARRYADGVTHVRVDYEGSMLRLAVEDNGQGVPAGQERAIFDRFHRVRTSDTRTGSGLGLSIVAEHCRAHGGRAWVESREEGGSRFVATFGAPEAS
jgi:signal transduction histidine kinase